MLMLVVGYLLDPVARVFVAPLPRTTNGESQFDQWRNNICLQSHPATCAPAAAATLLRFARIPSSERTLANACITSQLGTMPLGLYRGLAIASAHRSVRPAVVSSNPDRWEADQQLPNIALVRFDHSPRIGPLRRLLGPSGDGHAVVVLGRTRDGDWRIADPAFGRTIWSDQLFRERFTGDGIFLMQRDPVR